MMLLRFNLVVVGLKGAKRVVETGFGFSIYWDEFEFWFKKYKFKLF